MIPGMKNNQLLMNSPKQGDWRDYLRTIKYLAVDKFYMGIDSCSKNERIKCGMMPILEIRNSTNS
ncbi:hypothetical protein DYD21_06905 [Rhodohalobacter sp. SW132]|nr:hypothetical protein DYD21_06905 [Rhodohalobacter sp. SW132]